jgi:hypothetical protein
VKLLRADLVGVGHKLVGEVRAKLVSGGITHFYVFGGVVSNCDIVTISLFGLGERAGAGVDCLAALGVYRKSVGLLPQPIARKLSGGPQQHLGSKARPFIAFE